MYNMCLKESFHLAYYSYISSLPELQHKKIIENKYKYMEAGEIPVRSRHCKGIYCLSQIHILHIALREMELYDSRGFLRLFLFSKNERSIYEKNKKQ